MKMNRFYISAATKYVIVLLPDIFFEIVTSKKRIANDTVGRVFLIFN